MEFVELVAFPSEHEAKLAGCTLSSSSLGVSSSSFRRIAFRMLVGC